MLRGKGPLSNFMPCIVYLCAPTQQISAICALSAIIQKAGIFSNSLHPFFPQGLLSAEINRHQPQCKAISRLFNKDCLRHFSSALGKGIAHLGFQAGSFARCFRCFDGCPNFDQCPCTTGPCSLLNGSTQKHGCMSMERVVFPH